MTALYRGEAIEARRERLGTNVLPLRTNYWTCVFWLSGFLLIAGLALAFVWRQQPIAGVVRDILPATFTDGSGRQFAFIDVDMEVDSFALSYLHIGDGIPLRIPSSGGDGHDYLFRGIVSFVGPQQADTRQSRIRLSVDPTSVLERLTGHQKVIGTVNTWPSWPFFRWNNDRTNPEIR
jgi:hypothetical protein